jgi:TfoX/Sxy family transcriptional regulator of competence genes
LGVTDSWPGPADRIRDALPDDAPVHERTIFGGLAFLFIGNMFCCIVHDALLLRLGPDGVQRALAPPDVRPMDDEVEAHLTASGSCDEAFADHGRQPLEWHSQGAR